MHTSLNKDIDASIWTSYVHKIHVPQFLDKLSTNGVLLKLLWFLTLICFLSVNDLLLWFLVVSQCLPQCRKSCMYLSFVVGFRVLKMHSFLHHLTMTYTLIPIPFYQCPSSYGIASSHSHTYAYKHKDTENQIQMHITQTQVRASRKRSKG